MWIADFTYLKSWEGVGFFSFVLDVYSRRCVGWQLSSNMRADLVLGALKMVLGTRRHGADLELVHHSDRGSQYTSFEFTQALQDNDVLGSLGSTGDAYDNAMAESFVDSFKAELIRDRVWRGRTQLELAVVEWVGWYNHDRLHSALGYVSPVNTRLSTRHELHQQSLSSRAEIPTRKVSANRDGSLLDGVPNSSRGKPTAVRTSVRSADRSQGRDSTFTSGYALGTDGRSMRSMSRSLGRIGRVTSLSEMTQEQADLMRLHDEQLDEAVVAADAAIEMLRAAAVSDIHARNSGLLDPLSHGLQSATRAERDGASDAIVAALVLHDMFDPLAAMDHDRLAAEMLKPWVSDDVVWIVRHHGIFQQYNKWWLPQSERDARDRYLDHPLYASCVHFCDHWDQASFDYEYPSEPVEHFRPLLIRLFRGELRADSV